MSRVEFLNARDVGGIVGQKSGPKVNAIRDHIKTISFKSKATFLFVSRTPGTFVSFTLKDKTMQVAKNTEKFLGYTFIDTLTCP
jgi:hypothetical protein